MKKHLIYLFVLCSVFSTFGQAQRLVPAQIILKDGKTIEALHFGQLDCTGTDYFQSYILIKGKYNDQVNEINDYSKIKKIELVNFEQPPVESGNYEKGTIIIEKENGLIFTLDDATIYNSCKGTREKYNLLNIQEMNLLTDKVQETSISVMDIQEIIFKR